MAVAMLVKACLNGSRSRAEHAAIPLSPMELATEAGRAVAAGARALHVHPRRTDGSETLESDDCGSALRAIRAACPGIPVGLSTGIWIEGDPGRRLARIEQWTVLPDFVSVNFSEPGIIELCRVLISRRIGIEAGVWTATDGHALIESGLVARCLRILIEPREDNARGAIATADAIAALLDEHDVELPRLLHGEGKPTWPVLAGALERGYDIRIGFEDTLELPNGSQARDNGALVDAAIRLANQWGRPPASP